MPRPPTEVGENIICFENFGRGLLINLQIILSILFLNSFFRRGKMVAMCVSLESKHVLVMFTFAVVDNLVVDQTPS